MKERGQREPAPLKQSEQYRQTIENLKKETRKLKEQLCIDTLQQSNMGIESEIARLQEQGDVYVRKIEIEKKKISELDQKLVGVQEKIKQQRANMGGAHGAKETSEGIARKIKGLENKLDKSLQKYNEAVAHNKQLREQIDKLRRERVVYDNIYKKLEEELQQKKNEMRKIVELGNQAVKERDEAKKRMNELRVEAEKEQEEFENEWRELGKLIEKDKKMKDFIRQQDKPQIAHEEVEQSDRNSLTRNVAKSAWSIARDKASIRVALEKVEMYEEAFKKIEEATGISDIDELVRTFVEAEKNNYSLFNYVNELSNEMEKLEQQISDIKSEIEKYKGQGQSSDNQRKKQMSQLEARLERTEKRASKYEQKYEKTNLTIESLKEGIQELFERLGCNDEHAQETLTYQGVTEANMMQYLAIIEERTNEILQMYSACQAVSTSASPLLGHSMTIPVGPHKKLEMDPPSVPEREGGDDDETGIPMTKEDFLMKAVNKIQDDGERRPRRKQQQQICKRKMSS